MYTEATAIEQLEVVVAAVHRGWQHWQQLTTDPNNIGRGGFDLPFLSLLK